MTISCTAYLGMSLDGFIAGPDDDLAWLDAIPPPSEGDMGFGALMDSVDALVMGRGTFDVVMGFDIEWPYQKPVIVMSSTLTAVPEKARNTEVSALEPAELTAELEARGMTKLYVDGGAVISSFLRSGLLDELIVTVLPVVLGGGTKLFRDLDEPAWFELVSTEAFDNGMVQTTYRTKPATKDAQIRD